MPKKTLHIHHFGMRTYCGLIRYKEESTLTAYFNEEGTRCKSCALAMERRGYNMRQLEFRFSNKREGDKVQ